MIPKGTATALIKVLARVLYGPKWLVRHVTAATATVAEHLLGLLSIDLAKRVGKVNDAMIAKHVAEAHAARADARRRTAEAIAAENESRLAERKDRLATLEKRRRRAETRKAEAEADKAESEAIVLASVAAVVQAKARDIATKKVKTGKIEKAAASLKVAVRRLNQKGGGLFINTQALTRLLEAMKDIPDENSEGDDSER